MIYWFCSCVSVYSDWSWDCGDIVLKIINLLASFLFFPSCSSYRSCCRYSWKMAVRMEYDRELLERSHCCCLFTDWEQKLSKSIHPAFLQPQCVALLKSVWKKASGPPASLFKAHINYRVKAGVSKRSQWRLIFTFAGLKQNQKVLLLTQSNENTVSQTQHNEE